MDIHPPHGLVQNVKEFGIHIAIVTIGILIALSLEGIIEVVHDTRLVRETRENFQAELQVDRRQARKELARDREIHAALDQLVADLPTLLKNNPTQVGKRLAAIRTSGYFLLAESWQTALSTGALAHLPTDEVQRYGSTYYLLREYADVQRGGVLADDRAQAFFLSHAPLRPADFTEGSERIVLYAEAARQMEQVCSQLTEQIDQLLPPAPVSK